MKYIFLSILFFPFHVLAQYGCMDMQATNYNNTATMNDGSCVYSPTSYTLLKLDTLDNSLNEISGMVYWQGKLYAHNDGGNTSILYEIDTQSHQITKVINLPITNNIDWEDITQDSTHFYIADVGNNNGNRTDLKIYKFPKASIGSGFSVSVPDTVVEEIQFSYADQTDFTAHYNATIFDCEAVVYYNGMLHLFTKNWVNAICVHYTLPTTAGTYSATRLDSLNGQGISITGADIFNNQLMLIGYQTTAPANCALWYIYDFNTASPYFFQTGNKRKIDVGSAINLGQVEAICFNHEHGGYISNEKFNPIPPLNINPSLYTFSTTDWFPYQAFTPVENNINIDTFTMKILQLQYYMQVNIHSNKDEDGTITLHMTDGRVLFKKRVRLKIGENKIDIENDELLQGRYRISGTQMLSYSSDSKQVTTKLNVISFR